MSRSLAKNENELDHNVKARSGWRNINAGEETKEIMRRTLGNKMIFYLKSKKQRNKLILYQTSYVTNDGLEYSKHISKKNTMNCAFV